MGRKFSFVPINSVCRCVRNLCGVVVVEAAIRAKCEEEDWEYDSISPLSRVTFVYLSMRTTGTARKIATSGKRGDGLYAWRRFFQEYNLQLVTGAQALLRRALSMGRAKSVADVSDRIQELEELLRKYEELEGVHFWQRSRFRS